MTKNYPKRTSAVAVLLIILLIAVLGLGTVSIAFAQKQSNSATGPSAPSGYSGLWQYHGCTLTVKQGKVVGGQPKTIDLAVKALNQSGWDLHSAYNWCLKNITYTRVGQNNQGSLGLDQYAIQGFEQKQGNCWTFAACLYYMGKILGEDIHVVKGEVPYANGSYGPHAWNEVVRNGKTYVIDADYELTRKKNGKTPNNGYLFQYRAKGTWKYRNISQVI